MTEPTQTMNRHGHWTTLVVVTLIATSVVFLDVAVAPSSTTTASSSPSHVRGLSETMFDESEEFQDLFPLETPDYIGFACAVLGLMLAAGGGIGGGGILVPIYILLFEFPVKHAIPLASVTVLGGAVANNILNYPKHDPRHLHRSVIDWDLILQLEPMTMAGALMGAALNDFLPDLLLVVLLLILLTLTAHKTLTKAHAMYLKENQVTVNNELDSLIRISDNSLADKGPYGTAATYATADDSSGEIVPVPEGVEYIQESRRLARMSAVKLTALFVVVTLMNLLKGGTSEGGGPLGLAYCGEKCFWVTNAVILLLILMFSFWVRNGILTRLANDGAVISDIHWDEENTITFPALAIAAGLAAGMFGIGGGIVKGPLMLALGVHPAVASATSACMILFTATTSSISYAVFGLLNYNYSVASFVVGFLSTLAGQTIMGQIMSRYSHRHSYIAYSIGLVVALSAIAMGLESLMSLTKL